MFYIDCGGSVQLDYTRASGTAETAVVTIYDTLILIFCHVYIYIYNNIGYVVYIGDYATMGIMSNHYGSLLLIQ